jgi:hypothetical protein
MHVRKTLARIPQINADWKELNREFRESTRINTREKREAGSRAERSASGARYSADSRVT